MTVICPNQDLVMEVAGGIRRSSSILGFTGLIYHSDKYQFTTETVKNTAVLTFQPRNEFSDRHRGGPEKWRSGGLKRSLNKRAGHAAAYPG
jgi:hypothetical protein